MSMQVRPLALLFRCHLREDAKLLSLAGQVIAGPVERRPIVETKLLHISKRVLPPFNVDGIVCVVVFESQICPWMLAI